MSDRYERVTSEWRADLIQLLTALQKDIGDEYRASEDPDDDTPAMAITIATDNELSGWVYQTGDNSYSGACYLYPHWGLGTLTRECDPAEVVDELLHDMGEQWYEGHGYSEDTND